MGANESMTLVFDEPQAQRLMVGLSWEPNTNNDPLFVEKNEPHDLDLSCALISASGDVIDVITPQEKLRDKYKFRIFHKGDNLSGGAEFEDEEILLNLDKVEDKIVSIVFLLSAKSKTLLHEVDAPECSFIDYQSDRKFLSFDLSGFSRDALRGEILGLGKFYVLGSISRSNAGQWALYPAYAKDLGKEVDRFRFSLESVLSTL